MHSFVNIIIIQGYKQQLIRLVTTVETKEMANFALCKVIYSYIPSSFGNLMFFAFQFLSGFTKQYRTRSFLSFKCRMVFCNI